MPMVIGIDHGYYAIKTPHICFSTGLSVYDYETIYHTECAAVFGAFLCLRNRQASFDKR